MAIIMEGDLILFVAKNSDKDSKQNSNINNDDDDVSKDSDNKDSKQNGNINNDDDVSKDSDNKDSKQMVLSTMMMV